MKRTLAITMLVLICSTIAPKAVVLLSQGDKHAKATAIRPKAEENKAAKSSPKLAKSEKPEIEKRATAFESDPKDTIKTSSNVGHHKATWYRTIGTRVHKEHPEIHGTAAYNFVPRGTRLKITNVANGKYCIVEVTDRMGTKSKGRIDLSHSAFGMLEMHARGAIKVTIEIFDPIIEKQSEQI